VFGGGVLGCAKDYVHCCGLLGGGSTIAWGGLRFSVFFFFFLTAEGLCLEVGGFYGLIWQAMERLGIVDNDCAEMVVVVVLAQLG
jgi:hypothetical protein